MSGYSGTSFFNRDTYPDTDYGVGDTIYCELQYRERIECTINRVEERSAMEYKNLFLTIGDTKQYVCYVKDRNLNPIDISDTVCTFKAWEDTDEDPVIELETNVAGEGTIGAADQGEFYFYFQPATTSSLSEQQYPFIITIDFPSGAHYTVANGVLQLNERP